MKLNFFAATLFATFVLGACSEESSNVDPIKEDIKELVNEYSGNKTQDESASITSSQLIVTDKDKKELAYDLPEDEFFVSIAPYVNETHPCTNHSLTGCKGEMVDKEFDVYIEDAKGNVVVDETMNSQANGFIDLWLLRDETYTIKIEHEGKMLSQHFLLLKMMAHALQRCS